MQLAVIACSVFTGLLTQELTQNSPPCRIFYLEQGLHNTPTRLREEIQRCIRQIDALNRQAAPEKQYDGIALLYGFCGGGVNGICAGNLPLILPRTDDCMGILLGSQQRYLAYLQSLGQIYWLSGAWYDYAVLPSRERLTQMQEQFTLRFGAENARYLIDSELDTLKRYRNGVFIRSSLDSPNHTASAYRACEDFGWQYWEVDGDCSLLSDLLGGRWDNERFLQVAPHKAVDIYTDTKKD